VEQPEILVDVGELRSGIPKGLEDRGLKVVVRDLALGDYLVSDRVCVERKTTRDFASSIKTKRLFDQAVRLKEKYERPLLLIEGYDLYHTRGVHPGGIKGALVMIAVSIGLPIIFSRDIDDTTDLLATMAKQERAAKREISFYPKRKARSPSQEIERVVESFPGIGPVLSRQLLLHYNRLEDILSASTQELTRVPKIGKKKAGMIRDILQRDYRAGNHSTKGKQKRRRIVKRT